MHVGAVETSAVPIWMSAEETDNVALDSSTKFEKYVQLYEYVAIFPHGTYTGIAVGTFLKASSPNVGGAVLLQ